MKQVININFQGRVIPIEVTAFELLKNYTESLSRHFANEEGKDEIINDIESRIGELFQERLTKGATCITDDDVNAIIKSMGRPEEFEAADESNTTNAENAGSSQQATGSHFSQKRLYRDENHKILGGVCSGIANYFGIDSLIVRILFVISGIGFLAYILLWAFLPSSSNQEIGGTRKKLYRDSDDKVIAGVCSGLGNYFGVNAWIPRVLFALPFLSYAFKWGHWGFFDFPDFLRIGFSPGALIIYIILWMVIPEAVTTGEKLEMKGEKIDLNSIKNSVVEEMKGVQQRAQKFGKEASGFAKEKSEAVSSEINSAAKRTSKSFGDIILFLIKLFAYFIIGCVLFALVVGLFALAIASIGLFPLKDFIIDTEWQNAYAWGTLIFFIAVPIIGIITWIIRRLTKSKSHSKIFTLSFVCLWILGWVCVTLFVSSVSRDFVYSNRNLVEQELVLSNPGVNKLEITAVNSLDRYKNNKWLRFEPFEGLHEDTAFVKNFDVRIVKSNTDSFKVTIIKMACGNTRSNAEANASMIQFSGTQIDSILQLDKGIAINKTDKFRNQRIAITIYVPVGKRIKIDKSIGRYNTVQFEGPWNNHSDWDYDYDDEAYEWKSGVEYIMNTNGQLYTLNGIPAKKSKNTRVRINEDGIDITTEENNNESNSGSGNYRYNSDNPINKIDSLRLKLEVEQKKFKDSLQKVKDNIEKQLEKLGNNDDPGPLSAYMPVNNRLINMN